MAKRTAQHGGRREGAGRPRVLRDPQRVTLWLDQGEYEQLTAMAEREQLTLSEIVRQILTRHLLRRR